MTVTVVPLTVHTLVVALANDTTNPALDVADTVNGDTPYTRSANEPKVIVCDPCVMVSVASADVTVETAPDEPEFFTTTEYVPASARVNEANASELDVAPEMLTPFFFH